MQARRTRAWQHGAGTHVQAVLLVLATPPATATARCTAGSASSASAAWLAAVAATLCDSPRAAVLLASSADLVAAGAAAGMVAVAVPRKMAYAASYPAAAAKFEALGPGYATWQKLCSLYSARQQ